MIGSLRGTLVGVSSTSALIEVRGVGYRVQATPATLQSLGSAGSEIFVHIHHHIREDAQTLFGFIDDDGRQVFETLLGTHGVGPALALAIVSVHAPVELRRIIASEDLASMCLVPGVGKKTAQRLMIELKSRLVATGPDSESPGRVSRAASGPDARQDVREALAGLGYSAEEIASVTAEVEPDAEPGEQLRVALQHLARG